MTFQTGVLPGGAPFARPRRKALPSMQNAIDWSRRSSYDARARQGDRRRPRLQHRLLYGRGRMGPTFRNEPISATKFVRSATQDVSTDVWNDSAEIILHKAGFSRKANSLNYAPLIMVDSPSPISKRADYNCPRETACGSYHRLNLATLLRFGDWTFGAELAPGGPQPAFGPKLTLGATMGKPRCVMAAVRVV